MNSIALAMLTERLLVAALESSAIQRAMQSEGRTSLTDEEESRLRRLTDQAAGNAAAAVAKL